MKRARKNHAQTEYAVVGLSFGESVEALLRCWQILGGACAVKLHLVHAMGHLPAASSENVKTLVQESAAEAMQAFATYLNDVGADVVGSEVVFGQPLDVIATTAEQQPATIVVIGSRRTGTVGEASGGHPCEMMAKRTKLPTLLLPARPTGIPSLYCDTASKMHAVQLAERLNLRLYDSTEHAGGYTIAEPDYWAPSSEYFLG